MTDDQTLAGLRYQSLELDLQGIRFRLSLMEKHIMATVQEFRDQTVAALDALRTTVAAEKQQVIDALAELAAQVAALQAQIAAGDVVPPETVAEIQAAIADISTQVQGIQA